MTACSHVTLPAAKVRELAQPVFDRASRAYAEHEAQEKAALVEIDREIAARDKGWKERLFSWEQPDRWTMLRKATGSGWWHLEAQIAAQRLLKLASFGEPVTVSLEEIETMERYPK